MRKQDRTEEAEWVEKWGGARFRFGRMDYLDDDDEDDADEEEVA